MAEDESLFTELDKKNEEFANKQKEKQKEKRDEKIDKMKKGEKIL